MVDSMLWKKKARIVMDFIMLVGEIYGGNSHLGRTMTQKEIAEYFLGSASRYNVIKKIAKEEYGMRYGINRRGAIKGVFMPEYIEKEYVEELDRINVDYELLEENIRKFKSKSAGVRG